jgi:Flp pilus assembly protein TadD
LAYLLCLTLSACTPLAAAVRPLENHEPLPLLADERWQNNAEAYYLALARIRPSAAEPWFQLGTLYAQQGNLQAAEQAYREALRRRNNPETLHNLGLVQLRMGIVALREARRRLPEDDPVHQETRQYLRALLDSAL